jgi:hypothetical protein
MDPISLEDLALLEVLHRIDQRIPLLSEDTDIRKRLVESGLVADDEDDPRLTSAGIEMCKSLQDRRLGWLHQPSICPRRFAAW